MNLIWNELGNSSWLDLIGSMLIHSIWQLAAIGVLFYVVRAMLQQMPSVRAASANYQWACLCLFAMAAAPIVTLLIIENQPPNRMTTETESVSTQSFESASLWNYSNLIFESESKSAVQDLPDRTNANPAIGFEFPVEKPSSLTTMLGEVSAGSESVSSASSRFPWLVTLWLLGVLVAALRPVIGLLNVRRLSTYGISELPFSIGASADRINKNLSNQLGIALPSIRFVQSTLVVVPTVVGFFKPIVLLPVAALSGLTPRQLEMILAHEIAHIHRRDYIINVAQTIVETFLFYHPAVWMVSKEIRVERENCCDDMAVSAFGDAPAFARALLRLEQTNQARPPAMAANGGSLVKRVSRLIENPSTKRQSSAIGVCLTLMLVALFSIAIISSSQGQAAQTTRNSADNIVTKIDPQDSQLETESLSLSFGKSNISLSKTTVVETESVTLPAAPQGSSKNAVATDQLLALVNDLPIKRHLIVQESLRRHGNEVLESLITKQKLKDLCEKKGIVITQTEIDADIERKASKFGMSSQRYTDTITSRRNISLDRLHEILRSEMTLRRLIPNDTGPGPDQLAAEAAKLLGSIKPTVSEIKLQELLSNLEQDDIAAIVDEVKIKKSELAEMCFARFGQKILQNEINKTMLTQALENKGLHISQEELRAEIARAAMTTGHVKQDGTADVEEWLKSLGHEGKEVEFYLQDEVWPTVALKKLVAEKVVVTDQEMVKAYEANYGPRANALAIILNDHRTALKVWNLASANPTEEHFGKLAHQYSVEPASRKNHGAIPTLQAHGGQPKLTQVAFALEKNEISQVIQLDSKWAILFGKGLLVDHAWDVSFDSVKKELREQIIEVKLRELMHQEFEQLKANATINMIDTQSKFETDPSNQETKPETITLKVFAKTSGVVDKLTVSNGQSVTQDQLVVALKNQAIDLQLQELKEQIDPDIDEQIWEWWLGSVQGKQAALKVVAPLKGKVLEILVKPRQPVKAGQLLLRLEVAKQPGLQYQSRQQEFRELQSNFFQERASSERMLKTNPSAALERMRKLRLLVDRSDIAPQGKSALLTVVDRDLTSMEEYVAQEEAAKQIQTLTTTQTYAVADLIVPLDRGGKTQVFDGTNWNQKTETGTMTAIQPAGIAISAADAIPIIDLIKNTIEPDNWSDTSGTNTIAFFKPNLSLVVSAKKNIHDQVADLLEKLRELADVSIEIRSYIVIGSKEDFDDPALQQLPETKGQIDGRTSRYLQSLVRGKETMKLLKIPNSTLFNGQTARFQIKEFGNLKRSRLSLAPHFSADKQSVKTGFSASIENLVKKQLVPERFEIDPTFAHVVKKTPSGQSVALDLSFLLKDKSGQKAFFVFMPIVIDEGQR